MRKMLFLVCLLAATAVSWAQTDVYLIPNDNGTTPSTLDLTDKAVGYSCKIYDASGPNANYDIYTEGTLLVKVANGMCLNISGTVKANDDDYVEYFAIYDGSTVEDNLLGKFGEPSGQFVSVAGSTSNMLLHFKTYGWECYEGVEVTATIAVKDGDFVYADNAKTHLIKYVGAGGTVEIPSAVTNIDCGAFSGCNNLEYNTDDEDELNYLGTAANPYLFLVGPTSTGITECTINSNTKYIGREAFKNCSNLTTINVPSGVTSIGDNAFAGLVNVVYSGSAGTENDSWGARVRNGVREGDFLLGSNGTVIGAYYGEGGAIVIPQAVTAIASNVFENSGITSVDFSQATGLTTIGDYAFSNCDELTTVTIPASVTTMGYRVFTHSDHISTIYCVGDASASGWDGQWNYGYFYGWKRVPTIWDYDNWSIDENGELSFNKDYRCTSYDTYPWYGVSSQIKSVKVGADVTTIDSYAFDNTYGSYRNLVSVDFSEATNLVEIGYHAFYSNNGITTLNIPQMVSSIGYEAFQGVKCINYYGNAGSSSDKWGARVRNGYVEDGFVYSDNTKTYLAVYIGDGGSINIPSGVVTIGTGAFSNCTTLTAVSIPAGVESIESEAFYYCTALTAVNIPASVEYISYNAFYGCSSLATVDMSNATNLRYIYDYAFFDCTTLTAVSLPASVEYIGYNAFSSCSSLETVDMSNATNLRYIYSYAFSDCAALSSVSIPESIVLVDYGAFNNCSSSLFTQQGGFYYLGNNTNPYVVLMKPVTPGNISTLRVENGVKAVAVNAFNGCTDFPTTEGGASYVGSSSNSYLILAKASSTEITSCTINSNTKIIAPFAFWDCCELSNQKVTIPEGIELMGYQAFGCSNGSAPKFECNEGSQPARWDEYWNPNGGQVVWGADSYEIDANGVLTINKCVDANNYTDYPWYSKAESIKKVVFAEDVSCVGKYAFYNGNNEYNNLTEVELPSTMESIGDYAFQSCYNLSDINLDDATSLTSIGDNAFDNCDALTNINLGNATSLTSIGKYAFYDCDALTDLNLGNATSLTTIDKYAFYSCDILSDINLDNATSLTTIGEYAFAYCNTLTDINLSNATNLTSIGKYAFYYCSSLETIELPSSVTFIGEYAFNSYSNLEYNVSEGIRYLGNTSNPYLYLAKVNSTSDEQYTINANTRFIGINAFSGCSNLSSITIPASVTSIGYNAFGGCSKLITIDVPSTVTYIERNAFNDVGNINYNGPYGTATDTWGAGARNGSIDGNFVYADATRTNIVKYIGSDTEVTIPASVETIGNHAFEYKGITSVDFSQATQLTQIGEYAFCNTSLTEVAIPASVETIGAFAFYECHQLESVDFSSAISLATIDQYAFYYCDKLTSVVIPESVVILGDYAFAYCNSLTEIALPSSVKSLGSYVFSNCESLTEVDFSQAISLISIGYYVFSGCSNLLSSIEIPSTVTNISSDAFYGIKNIIYNGSAGDASEKFGALTRNGTIYGNFVFADEAKTNLTGYTSKSGSVTIPAGVTTIGNYAFDKCSDVTVTIPSALSISSIGQYAFNNIANVINYNSYETNSPWGAKKYFKSSDIDIDENGFIFTAGSERTELIGYMGSATDIVIPQTVTSIADEVFKDLSITSVDFSSAENLESIGQYAFYNCDNLTSIYIPATVTSMGYYAFADCSNLSINCEAANKPDGWHDYWNPSGRPARWLCDAWDIDENGLLTVKANVSCNWYEYPWRQYKYDYGCNIKGVTFAEGVTTIGEGAFHDAYGWGYYNDIKKVTIPSTVTTIGNDAFYSCSNISSVYFASLNSLCNIDFEDYDSNPIRNGATLYINGEETTEITIPEDVTSIGQYAFYNCDNITKVVIHDGVESVGTYAFYDCNNLIIWCEAGAKPEGWHSNWNPSGRTVIWDCTNWSLSEEGVLTVRKNYDYDSSSDYPWYELREQITAVEFAGNVTTIGDYAFYDYNNLQLATMPAGFTTIGGYAFSNCGNLKMVDLSNTTSLATIGNYAFSGCSNLQSLTIPATVTTIGKRAFYDCQKLETIDLSELTSLVEIGDYAFYNCDALTAAVTVPASVETIGECAFYDCDALTVITIPASVQTVGNQVFYGSDNLSIIYCEAESKPDGWDSDWNYGYFNDSWEYLPVAWDFTNWSLSSSGKLTIKKEYTAEGAEGYPWHQLRSQITSVEYDNSKATFTTIGNYAFYGCGNLTAIEIPASVESIGNYAFSGCNTLGNVVIPASVETIGELAFYNCYALTEITIPAGVQTMGSRVFYGCDYLSIIYCEAESKPNGWAGDWNYGVFNGSWEYLPVLWDCNNLSLSDDGMLTVTKDYEFDSYDEYPWYSFAKLIKGVTFESGVSVIGDYAFYNNSNNTYPNLATVVIPATVTEIGEKAFRGSWNLTTADLKGAYSLTTIGAFAFYSCGLTEITIPANVTSIGDEAFEYCNNVESINLNSAGSLESIGMDAFYDCFKTINIDVPSNVTYIGDDAFYNIKNLKYNGSYGSSSDTWGALARNAYVDGDFIFSDGTKTCLLGYTGNGGNITIPSTVVTIYDMAFYQKENITGVVISGNVMEIGSNAFADCPNLATLNLSNATSLTTIGSYAFDGCNALTSVIVPSTVTYIQSGAFSNCENLKTVNLNNATNLKTIEGYAFYNCYALKSITIPATVTTIDNYAFSYCNALESITIPASVTSIGQYAFGYCEKLASADLSNSAGLKYIGDGAFRDCIALKSIVIPSKVNTIGNYAFKGCTSLQTVNLNNATSLREIYNSAFENCSSLATIDLSKAINLENIYSNAFSDCDALTQVTIPAKVRGIDYAVFSGCDNLRTVNLNNAKNLTYISDYAFSNCTLLTSAVVIPEKVNHIGYGAFEGCSALSSVSIPDGIVHVGDEAFAGCSNLTFKQENGYRYLGNSQNPYVVLVGVVDPNNMGNVSNNVKTVAAGAFENCETFPTTADGACYVGNSSNPHLILARAESEEISSCTINSNTRIIAPYAFMNCYNLSSVDIPLGVMHVGFYAFYDNGSSPVINCHTGDMAQWDPDWEDGCEVNKAVGGWEFDEESGLLTVKTNVECEDFDYYPWYDLINSIKEVQFTDDVSYIGDYAFYNYDELTKVTIPASVTSIGNGAFDYCDNLATVDFSNASGLESIGEYAFAYIYGLPEADLSGATNLKSIGRYAFYNDYHLNKIVIPASVLEIGEYVFVYGNSNTKILCEGNGPAEGWDSNWTWNSIIWHYNNNTLSLSTNNSSYGSVVTNTVNDEDVNQVISNHTYTYGDVVEIEAVRNGGNIFLRWSDGNTTTPRTITITDNLSLEAVFGNNGTVYTVNVWTNQSSWGTVTGTGNGNYISGDLVELVAEPAEHYHFAYWSDDEENTNPNRSFNIDGNVSFYAVFEPAPCTVTVNVTGQGTVDSENQYGYGTWPTINSYPADGWYLAYWTTPNGNAFDGSYSFGVYEDMTLTAVFKPVQNVTVGTNTIEAYGQKYGSNCNCKFVAEVSGEYIIYGASQQNSPYIYLCDANGNILAQTSNKIIIDLEAGETYLIGAGNSNEAIEKMQLFVMAPVSITAQGNGGTFVGGGEYTYGDDVTVTATPNDGMFFVKWSDGENKNTYSLKAYANTTLNAEFNAVHQVVEGVNAVVGYYSGVTDNYNCEFTPSFSGPYVFFSESENDTYGVLYDADKNLLASDDNSGENGNFSFTYYLNQGETYYFAASYIYTGNAGEEMNFVVGTPVSVTASVVGNGSVQGAGMYAYGSNVTLNANPESGSRFVRWSDLSTANPYQFKIYEDIQLQALFTDVYDDVYTVSAVVNNNSYGSVSGGSNYIAGEEVTLTVTANDGYTFICWGDGETANPRIFSASENVSLMAILTREGTTVHTVSATANDANMGNVTGGRIYADGETATLSAEPVSGYKFVRWSNGSIDNPYSFTVTENTTVEALFVDASTPVYTVTVGVPSASANYGTVSGGGVFLSGETATLTATAAEHYQFVKWSNNETDNPLGFTVNSDVDLAAVFDLVSYNVTIVAENGIVTNGDGLRKYGTWTTISVQPAEHYHFVGWADGETSATRTEQVLGDLQFTALFEKDKYTINAGADNDATVSGTGEYEYEATATLTVTPAEGYHFVKWSDDATAQNPRQIVVDKNLDLYAQTAINEYQVTVDAANGTVEGITNPYTHGSEDTFTAVPADGYRFVRWSATNRENPFTMQITSNVVLRPLFASPDDDVYDVVVSATEGGAVTGGGIFLKDEKTTITATPDQGYHFVKWSNGKTETSFELTVTETVNIKAEFDKNVHTLTVSAGANGTVTGGGTVEAGSSAEISATAAEGYHFVRWSDGNTNAERTITMNSDLTLTAEFAINTYAVTATAKNGKVEGAGTYNHGTEATLTAVANEGYHFTKWSDGVTTATRKVTVTSALSFTAEFEINSYVLTVSATNGTVEGAGTYTHGAKVIISATAAEGYTFTQWSDGEKRAKRTVVVTSDTTFTAQFVANEYTVKASATNGTVTGAGTYSYGSEATLTATAAEGYHFTKWSDGVETATRKVTVKSDLSFTAEFAADTYTISVVLDSAANGTITGAGTYTYGATVTLEATANAGYHFVMWTDSVTTETRTVKVVGNATFSAVFAGDSYTLTVKAKNNGTVEGEGTYEYGSEATLTATANVGYIFSKWDDGNTDNPRTVTVTGNKTYTATFEKAAYTVTVNAENGQITGATETLKIGATVTLTAVADSGYHFVMWSDSVTDNPRTITVTAELLQTAVEGNVNFTAFFEKDDNTAIADEAAEDVNIFAFGNTIVVENADSDIFIYDAMGRLINREKASAQRTEIQINGAGIYVVKTGNTAKRVMIND